MGKEIEIRQEGNLFIPLAETFKEQSVNVRWVGDMSSDQDTVHIMLVNAQDKNGIVGAIEQDIEIVNEAISDSDGNLEALKGLNAQKESLTGMLNGLADGSGLKHDAPQELLDAVDGGLRKNMGMSLDRDQVCYTSGISHYREYDM